MKLFLTIYDITKMLETSHPWVIERHLSNEDIDTDYGHVISIVNNVNAQRHYTSPRPAVHHCGSRIKCLSFSCTTHLVVWRYPLFDKCIRAACDKMVEAACRHSFRHDMIRSRSLQQDPDSQTRRQQVDATHRQGIEDTSSREVYPDSRRLKFALP